MKGDIDMEPHQAEIMPMFSFLEKSTKEELFGQDELDQENFVLNMKKSSLKEF